MSDDSNNIRERNGDRPWDENGSPLQANGSSDEELGVNVSVSESRNAQEKDTTSAMRVRTPPSSPITGFIFPGLSASPPKFVPLEQIMKAAKGVSNMVLAHEIAIDKDFKLEKVEPPQGSLHHQVKQVVHQAFWNVLEEELKEDPPSYAQAMVLLEEVKQKLLSLLLPQHTRLRNQICEVLDVDLIRQQADHEVLDFQQYSQYVLSVMARLCAPIRDERIKELMGMTEVVPIFRGILELLDLMGLDMANFMIQQIRPHIQQQSIEYEKKKFREFLEAQKEMNTAVDCLEFTRQWLKRSYEREMESSAMESPERHKPEDMSPSPTPAERCRVQDGASFAKILISAYMELLDWDDGNIFPETLLVDQSRFLALRDQINSAVIVACVLMVTYSTVGGPIQDIAEFKKKLKSQITILLEGCTQFSEEELKPKLEVVAEKVVDEVQKCLTTHGYSSLEKSREQMLKGQITEIASPDHCVRKLIKKRTFEFVEQAIASPTASPLRIPPGLSSLQTELENITGQFLWLVSHNRAVFGEYYADIICNVRYSVDDASGIGIEARKPEAKA